MSRESFQEENSESGMIHPLGIILLEDSVLKGNGMVSDPSGKKKNSIFFNPLSALENTEVFF